MNLSQFLDQTRENIFRKWFLPMVRVEWGRGLFNQKPYAKVYFGKSLVSHIEAYPNEDYGFEIIEVFPKESR